MNPPSSDWKNVRKDVIEDACTPCSRNPEKRGANLKLMLDRASTKNIRYVFVSQDPALFYVKPKDADGLAIKNGADIHHVFVWTCQARRWGPGDEFYDRIAARHGRIRERGVIEFAKMVLGSDSFDPESGEVYWSHIMKCPPKTDNDEFKRDWRESGRYCSDFLRKELEAIESDRFCVVCLGDQSLKECSRILQLMERVKKMDREEGGIVRWHVKQVRELETLGTSSAIGGKSITLLAFMHPSSRYTRPDEVAMVEDLEPGVLRRLYPG